MKRNIGPVLGLYPTPLVVVGAMVEGRANWTLVGHLGIIGHDRIMVSMAAAHHSNKGIRESRVLSVNVVDEAMLQKADYTGSVSGAKTDKSEVFAYHIGENGAPVIDESPLTMECSVEDIYQTPGFESFILSITGTFAEEAVLNDAGKLDYSKLKPVLFEMPGYTYLKTGETLGHCLKLTQRPDAKEYAK